MTEPTGSSTELSDQTLARLIQEKARSERLEPLSPSEAIDQYLVDVELEYAKLTLKSHKSRLKPLKRFFIEKEIENMNIVTGRKLQEYRIWRRKDSGISKATEKTEQDTVRVFITWCETIDAVLPGLSDKVRSPTLSDDENTRDTIVTAEEARAALEHLSKYSYASLEHMTWSLLTELGARTGTLVSLDKGDYHNRDDAYLDIQHRPEETPLKRGENGERLVSLSEECATIIEDYLDKNSPIVKDEFGRRPLLATRYGRIAPSTIRRYTYKWTRPCAVGKGCPHGRNPEECEAAIRSHDASKCPSSKSPHPVRRGSITHELRAGVPSPVIAGRCNVSEGILKLHYDQRNEAEVMNHRKNLREEIYEEVNKYGK